MIQTCVMDGTDKCGRLGLWYMVDQYTCLDSGLVKSVRRINYCGLPVRQSVGGGLSSSPIYASVCLFLRMSDCPSVHLFVRLSVHLSVCLSIFLSVCLPVRPSVSKWVVVYRPLPPFLFVAI